MCDQQKMLHPQSIITISQCQRAQDVCEACCMRAIWVYFSSLVLHSISSLAMVTYGAGGSREETFTVTGAVFTSARRGLKMNTFCLDFRYIALPRTGIKLLWTLYNVTILIPCYCGFASLISLRCNIRLVVNLL